MASDAPQGYLSTEFTLQNDPLVNDSSAGFGGWFGRVTAVFSRSGKALLPLFALTMFAPAAILGALNGSGGLVLFLVDPHRATSVPDLFPGAPIVASLVSFPAGIMQIVGFAAATYIATRQAAGMTVGLAEGLRYGLRRCVGLLGWYFAAVLVIGLPVALVMACLIGSAGPWMIIPMVPLGLLALLALAMVGPAYLFERGNALTRSLRLFRGAPVRVALRLLPILLAYGILAGVGEALAFVLAAQPESASQPAVQAGVAVIAAAATTLGLMIVFAGILVTYAERRGDEGSLTPDLVNQL